MVPSHIWDGNLMVPQLLVKPSGEVVQDASALAGVIKDAFKSKLAEYVPTSANQITPDRNQSTFTTPLNTPLTTPSKRLGGNMELPLPSSWHSDRSDQHCGKCNILWNPQADISHCGCSVPTLQNVVSGHTLRAVFVFHKQLKGAKAT